MTKKIEDELNLPRLEEVLKIMQEQKEAIEKKEILQSEDIYDIDDEDENDEEEIIPFQNLPISTNIVPVAIQTNMQPFDERVFDKHDIEMDEIAQKALDSYEKIMELGFETESRVSSDLFSVASSMLKNAMDARNSKLEKKLKAIKAEMERLKLNKSLGGLQTPQANSPIIDNADVIVTNRNKLLETLRNNKTEEDKEQDPEV